MLCSTFMSKEKQSFIDFLYRYILWVLAFTGLYLSHSVCPCCGAPVCPVGGGIGIIFGIISASIISIVTFFKTVKKFFIKIFSKIYTFFLKK
jgi:hypothetical protein